MLESKHIKQNPNSSDHKWNFFSSPNQTDSSSGKYLSWGLTVNTVLKKPWWQLISNCSSHFEKFWLVGSIPPAPSVKQFSACDNFYLYQLSTNWAKWKLSALLGEFLTNTEPQKRSCAATAHTAQQRWEFLFQRSLLFHFIMTILTAGIFSSTCI